MQRKLASLARGANATEACLAREGGHCNRSLLRSQGGHATEVRFQPRKVGPNYLITWGLPTHGEGPRKNIKKNWWWTPMDPGGGRGPAQKKKQLVVNTNLCAQAKPGGGRGLEKNKK